MSGDVCRLTINILLSQYHVNLFVVTCYVNLGWRNKVNFYKPGDEEFVRQIQLWLYCLSVGVESENESLYATLKLKTYTNE